MLALLVAQYRRLDLAEDALADAFEAATRTWPRDGVPANPPAWLLTTARRRVVDRLRAEAMAVRKVPLLVVEADVQQRAHAALADPGGLVPDERLRLLLLCAHPSLAPEAASALSLRLVLGVSTEDVARLFLTSTPTMAARLTRAKKKLVAAGVPLAVPDETALVERVGVVGVVAYLAFTAGYAPGSGPDPVRVDLASDGIRLDPGGPRAAARPAPAAGAARADAAAALPPRRPRRPLGPEPALVLLPDQDRSRWHHDEIAEGLGLLRAVLADPGRCRRRHPGADAAGDDRRRARHRRDRRGHPLGPDRGGLRRAGGADRLRGGAAQPGGRGRRGPGTRAPASRCWRASTRRMPHGHRLPATRAALLARAGDAAAARTAYDVAIERCGNDSESRHLAQRARRRSAVLRLDGHLQLGGEVAAGLYVDRVEAEPPGELGAARRRARRRSPRARPGSAYDASTRSAPAWRSALRSTRPTIRSPSRNGST